MNSSSTFSDSSESFENILSLIFTLLGVMDTFDYVAIAFGILPNLWILLATLTSPDLRARMRNKIVCSFCVLHLLNCLLFMPMEIEIDRLSRRYDILNCDLRNFVKLMELLQDFISNWTLVLLVVVFIARICDFKPCAGLTSLTTTLGTYAILISPWVASLVIIPGVRNSLSHYVTSNISSTFSGCMFTTSDETLVIKSLDTAVPMFTAVTLMVTAVVLRRRRFTRGSPGDMEVELIERGPEVDGHIGYTAAVGVSLVCDFATAFMSFDLVEMEIVPRWVFYTVACIMSQTKVFLTPLPWLLFPDIRERVKTWRPWRRAKPGIDVTLVFKNVHS
ncbi:unnamed protein product [Lymnaea stagnalis]|uniref:G-protein coupled receptors family 1 profile domain-containing protein n=1 Tax=Lymnaea stagnalis TaxID=6523 RepID=A0AAV2HGQ7_LYMST